MPAKGATVTAASTSPDLLVLGGGIAGLACAWRAAAAGARVEVLVPDPAETPPASDVAAGMLAPVVEADAAEPGLLALTRAAAAAWPAFAREVEAASGLPVPLHGAGTLVVGRDREAASWLGREADVRARLGLPVERLLPSAARRLEPALAPTVRAALEVPGDGAVDPRALLAALTAAARAAGAVLRHGGRAAALLVEEDRVAGARLADGGRLAAGEVLVAAGAWSGALPGLPVAARVPVRPLKGQALRLRDPAGAGLVTRVLRWEEGYLVPRGDGGYVLGATQEERGFDASVTADGVLTLLRDASDLVPGVRELVLEAAVAAFRPVTPDNRPLLGPGAVAGLRWATGGGRNGVLLAPLVVPLALAGTDAARAPDPALAGAADPRRLAARAEVAA